jgi:hypothetical protein
VGKGWAKGPKAATDPRIARAAAGHRGKQYVRRTPFELCRWPFAGLTTLPLAWSDDMVYIVGLTATDGCLITGRRATNFKSGHGKRSSVVLLPLLYPATGPCLERKRAKWIRYAQLHGLIG